MPCSFPRDGPWDFTLSNFDPPLFLRGREDDERARLAHSADRVQLLDQEAPKRGHVLDADLEEQRELAGDVMALENLIERPDALDESLFELRVLDEDLHEGGDVVAELPLIEDGDVAADVSGPLQLSDPLVHRGSGEPDRAGYLGLGDLRVLLQEGEDLEVGSVRRAAVFYFDSALIAH